MFLSSSAASMILKDGSLTSKAPSGSFSPQVRAHRRRLEPFLTQAASLPDDVPRESLAQALEAEARRRFGSFLEGVQLYRAHPYRRRLVDPPAIWQCGAVRLLDYGGPADGPPVVCVPSLINRGYVLDLSGRRSFVRHLAKRGFRVFLVDWGWPGEDELGLDLTGYITRRLEPALEEVVRLTGQRAAVVGYCMGGVLSLAACRRRPDLVAAFVALATPWNFHADKSGAMKVLLGAREWLAEVAETMGELPVDLIQSLFSGLDPHSIARKFRTFATLPQNRTKAWGFVALEDWINDGVPLPGRIARECVMGWYGANSTASLAWAVDDQVVDPGDLACPTLVVIPAHDRIVPPESARALAEAIPQAEALTVPLGHIGMITGSAAVRAVYGPVVRWLRRCATHDTVDSVPPAR